MMAELNIGSDADKIVKEVFSKKDIETKTELSREQIEAINLSRSLCKLFGSPFWENHITDFMVLQKSKDRKSMGEFVESLRSKKDELIKKAKSFAMFG